MKGLFWNTNILKIDNQITTLDLYFNLFYFMIILLYLRPIFTHQKAKYACVCGFSPDIWIYPLRQSNMLGWHQFLLNTVAKQICDISKICQINKWNSSCFFFNIMFPPFLCGLLPQTLQCCRSFPLGGSKTVCELRHTLCSLTLIWVCLPTCKPKAVWQRQSEQC